ncbi:DUF421 domain-containing protein [Niallia sp. Krafla_26]|uniref:DUF421 domain-containing protein n=1 Tax=Niallia sp. Krafla_26 TaxID=3064703 RepID=UPI003D164FAC
MDHLWIPIIRTIVSFLILMIVTLWLGKQVNANLNHYNFALAITIGSFIANMGFDYKLNFFPMLTAFLSLICIYFIFSYISSHSRIIRKWLSGRPSVIIEQGRILDSNMKKIKYTLDDLNQHLREQGIFDITEVEYAVLEVSGKLSVLKKDQYQPIVKKDIFPDTIQSGQILPIELIMDGAAIEKNLKEPFTKQWLDQQLKQRKLQVKEIQYAVITTNGSLFVDLYTDSLTSPTDIE